MLFRAALSRFLLRGRPRSLLGALVLSDELGLREQHFAKRAEYLQQQIELAQTLAPSPHRAEKNVMTDNMVNKNPVQSGQFKRRRVMNDLHL